MEIVKNGVNVLQSVIEKTIEFLAGLFADMLGASSASKPKLQFAIIGTRSSELVESKLRTKYSHSDYSIEIYNIGPTPFVLDHFALMHKKGMYIDCSVSEEDKTVSQQKNMVYILPEQDAETLRWFCKRDRINKCQVWAYDIAGKCIKTKIDVSSITFQVQISAEDMIVVQ